MYHYSIYLGSPNHTKSWQLFRWCFIKGEMQIGFIVDFHSLCYDRLAVRLPSSIQWHLTLLYTTRWCSGYMSKKSEVHIHVVACNDAPARNVIFDLLQLMTTWKRVVVFCNSVWKLLMAHRLLPFLIYMWKFI
jgi:hypothetical protein